MYAIARSHQSTTTKGKKKKPCNTSQGESKNDAHFEPDLPSLNHNAPSSNQTFNTPNIVKLIKHIMVSNIQSVVHIYDLPVPLNPTMIDKGVPPTS